MYLKQLEIHGFKSFAERIELNFVNAINAVVGPNGSGKSNISDAIRWVLGEQSAKTLRGSRMEDIIFAGSDSKKPLGFAEVMLCIDNSDRKLPVEYTEINITRRIYRSGESEYYINKTQCRLKDVYELFMDTGIGRDGYSIIGQGRIDEILSNKSEDRRLVFEEAAGIVKYKTRKQEAEKKLEQTKQNIIRLTDIVEEIGGQLEPLHEQAEVAKRYRGIIEELKSIEINLFVNNIDKLRSKLEGIKNEEEGIQELINGKISLTGELEQKHSELKLELALLENNIAQLSEEVHQKRNLGEKYDGECNVLQEKINNINSNIERLHKRKAELAEECEETGKNIASDTKLLEELDIQLKQINESIELKNQEFESNYQSINVMEVNLNEKQQSYIELINAHSELKSRINSSNAFIENIKKRIIQVEGDMEALENQKKEKEELYDRSLKELDTFRENIEACGVQIETLKHDKLLCEDGIRGIEDKASAVKNERDQMASRLKVLEDMEKDHGGYSRSVKVLLTEYAKLIKGSCGVIGEMIKVPHEYVTAIEMALGGSIQNIVTDNEEDAKRLIEYLKENKIGRATFLPISSVRSRSFNDREKSLFKLNGFIGIASELIGYDKRISNVIASLLGRIAVVEDIDTAIRLARSAGYDFRIVTLSGEIINAGGSITGGSLHSASTSVLSRKSEIETLSADCDKKRSQLQQLLKELEKEKEGLALLNENISKSNELFHGLQLELNNQKNKSDNLHNEVQIVDDRISISKKEISDLNNECTDTMRTMQEISEKAQDALMHKQIMEAEISELQEQLKQFQEIKDSYNTDITELKVRLNSVEHDRDAAVQELQSLKLRLEELAQELAANETETEAAVSSVNEYLAELEKKKAEIEVLKAETDEKGKLLEEKEADKLALHSELQQIEDNVRDLNKDISSLQGSLHRIEMQHAKAEMELENLELKLLETYDINYYKAQEMRDTSINLTWASRRCEELKGEIREMGTVNVNAIEEHERLNQRFIFLNTQIEDMSKARDMLIDVIVEISEKMKLQFITEFHKINENFNEVFVKLFGGGQAELVLSDMDNILESGIEIIAKPPGKKLQNLSLLSGGERALTAIALLFGILKMKPAPFCVLDEIDAALDDANVDRYAEFLAEFSRTTQFIIVTHRKGTMEAADCLYGVSMEDSGVSKLISVKLEDKVS